MGELFASKKSSRSEKKLPPWLEQGAKFAVERGQQIANRPYTPYTGDRVAPLSESETMGIGLAQQRPGGYQPYLDKAGTALDAANQRFTDADISRYMSPYIEGALAPGARKINQAADMERSGVHAQAAQRSAFGGSRHAMLESLNEERRMQELGDHYGEGYDRAFQQGTALWQADQDRQQQLGQQYGALGNLVANLSQQDIDNMMQTGAIERGVDQAEMDFDYGQFVEGRDWLVNNLMPFLQVLSGVPHGVKQTGKETAVGFKAAVRGD